VQLTGLHHVAIIVSDYARSKAFYVETLGLQVLNETYRADRDSWKLDVALGDGTQLEIFTMPGAPERPSYPEALGLRHLAFAVQDLDDTVEDLKGCGVACETIRVDALTGRRFTFFADPDGLPLELYESD